MKDATISEAEALRSKGLFYLSAVEYAIAFHRSRNKGSLDPVSIFSASEISKIMDGVRSEIGSIEKVLSFGSSWNDDEFMLVYTFLMKHKLLLDYFQFYKLPFDLSIDHILDAVSSVQKDEMNNKEASKAKRMIMKNRKDLSKEWLQEVLI